MIQALQSQPDLVRQHLDALRVSSMVTGWYRKSWEPNVEHVTVEGVIKTLHRAGIRPVLMGTHGIGGYRSEARATQDVDVLVTKRDLRKAVRVLEAEYPYLEPRDTSAVTRFLNLATMKVELDVMKPSSRAMQVVFRNTIAVGETHRIPTLEMALASKFVAMIAPLRRQAKRQVDLGDFIDVVEHNRAALDLAKLKRLGDLVHPHGGTRMLELIVDIDAGRTIQLGNSGVETVE
jgi:hypothetical protein